MSGRCPECGSAELVEDSHYSQEQLVCAECGCVVTEGLLTTTLQDEACLQAVRFSESTGQNDTISKAKLKGIIRVRNLCRVLSLPGSFADTAVSYYEQAFHHPLYHCVHLEKKEAIIGCCVYITCRQHHWPLTMGTVSSMLYSRQKVFNSIFLEVAQSLKLDIPSLSIKDLAKNHCSSFRLFQSNVSAPPGYAEDLDKVIERTMQITELAGETWLVTGRQPVPIITAAAYLSWQSLNPVKRLSCMLHKFCKLCETDNPAPSGIRITEFMKIFMKLAQQLPWLKMPTLTKKTVIQHLGDILKHRAYLLRKTLAAEEPEEQLATESEEPIPHCYTSTFLPPCLTNPKKRRYATAFPDSQYEVTGEEDILDSEIEQYLRTPAEMKEYMEAQAKMLLG